MSTRIDKDSLSYRYKVVYISSFGPYKKDCDYDTFSVIGANCQTAVYTWIQSMGYRQISKVVAGDIIVVCPEVSYLEHLHWKHKDPMSKAFMKASFVLEKKQGLVIPKVIEMCVSRSKVLDHSHNNVYA